MSKIHIALVGEQIMPVFLGIRESLADRVVLVCSKGTKKQADLIADKVPVRCDFVLLSPTDISEIAKEMDENKILSECDFDEDDIEINVSGGTKPWSILFAVLAAKHTNVRLLYIDQNCCFYDFKVQNSWMAQPFDGIEQLLKISNQGTDKIKYVPFASYTSSDFAVMSEVKAVRKNYPKIFNELTIPRKDNNRRYSNNLVDKIVSGADSVSEISWDRRDSNEQVVKLDIMDKTGAHHVYTFKSPHAYDIVISSGWFEYEIACVLNKWQFAKEIWLNVKFPYENSGNQLTKNEIDIIVATDYKLLFVECKTQIFDNTDIDKFSAAVKAYGGLSAKSLFITDDPMTQNAAEKCRTNKILSHSMKKQNGNVKNFVSEKELFNLLDLELGNNNTR